jgi:hypothetical protein
MNTEKTFKLILIFVLICGIIGCYTKKDIENFSSAKTIFGGGSEEQDMDANSQGINVRCCKDGKKIKMSEYGCIGDCNPCRNKNFDQANKICNDKGFRLCSINEIESGKTKGTGCGFDLERVWATPRTTKKTTEAAKAAKTAKTIGGGGTSKFGGVELDMDANSQGINVRCCKDGSEKIKMSEYGCIGDCNPCRNKNFDEAQKICNDKGFRLCSINEIESGKTKGTGCGFDLERVWATPRTKKDIENIATDCNRYGKKITGPDGTFLCFPKRNDGAYNVNISEGNILNPNFIKIEGINCSPNCKSCGFSDNPSGKKDCIICKDGYTFNKEWTDGTGSCSKEEEIGSEKTKAAKVAKVAKAGKVAKVTKAAKAANAAKAAKAAKVAKEAKAAKAAKVEKEAKAAKAAKVEKAAKVAKEAKAAKAAKAAKVEKAAKVAKAAKEAKAAKAEKATPKKCLSDTDCKNNYYCNSNDKNCMPKIKKGKYGCDQDSITSCEDKNFYCGWYKDTVIPVCLKKTNKLGGGCLNKFEQQKLKEGDDIRKKQRLCDVKSASRALINELSRGKIKAKDYFEGIRCEYWPDETNPQGHKYFCANN